MQLLTKQKRIAPQLISTPSNSIFHASSGEMLFHNLGIDVRVRQRAAMQKSGTGPRNG